MPPEWLEPAALEEVLRQERESASFQASCESFSPSCASLERAVHAQRRPRLAPRRASSCARAHASSQPLPFHYIEIATVLFKNAGDAFGDRRQRVQDLFESIRR